MVEKETDKHLLKYALNEVIQYRMDNIEQEISYDTLRIVMQKINLEYKVDLLNTPGKSLKKLKI